MRDFYQTGTKYELMLATRPQSNKMEISIRLKEGVFSPNSNTVGVLVDKDMLSVIIKDLGKHLEELK